MPATVPSKVQLAKIQDLANEAERLITAAEQESLKREVEMARRDLRDAHHYLQESNVDARPSVLSIVHLTIQLADYRLQAVDRALKMYGPTAMMIG
jgi:phytoene/squalene synthetase